MEYDDRAEAFVGGTPFRSIPFRRGEALPSWRVQYDVIDLFAGCGGLTLGLAMTGRFKPTLAVEFDPDAADTYAPNFARHVARFDDGRPMPIEDVPGFPSAHVVVGGPPCQGFSPLNMRRVG